MIFEFQAPVSFTQQLQRHSRHHGGRSSQGTHVTQAGNGTTANGGGGGGGNKYGNKKHSNLLPNVQEYQSNIGEWLGGCGRTGSNNFECFVKFTVNEADLFDLGCMSPLYASPPHSPSSDVSSPGQQHGEEAAHGGGGGGEGNAKGTSITDNHFTRDTHMRIILGGGKAENGGAQS